MSVAVDLAPLKHSFDKHSTIETPSEMNRLGIAAFSSIIRSVLHGASNSDDPQKLASGEEDVTLESFMKDGPI